MTSYDLTITQGSTYNLTLTLSDDNGNPLNLSTYTISGFIKYNYSTGNYLVNLNPIIAVPQSGIVNISVPASGTQLLPINIGVYDISITETGSQTTSRALNGRVYVYPDVTH